MFAFISDTGIVVAVIAFVALFGASQIPKLARNLGEAGREFRKAHAELADPTAVGADSSRPHGWPRRSGYAQLGPSSTPWSPTRPHRPSTDPEPARQQPCWTQGGLNVLDISPEKLLVVITIALAVLGPEGIPRVARGLAKARTEIRRLTADVPPDALQVLTNPRGALLDAVSGPRQAVSEAVSPTPPGLGRRHRRLQTRRRRPRPPTPGSRRTAPGRCGQRTPWLRSPTTPP